MPIRKRGFKHYYSRGKIEIDGDCWIWLGCQTRDGYGQIKRPPRNGEKHSKSEAGWISVTAQHFFFELYKRVLSKGEEAGHICHRRLCVRPKHLKACTKIENLQERYIDQKFNEEQVMQVKKLLQEGLVHSEIASKMKVPRPYIRQLAKTLDWRSLDLFE